MIATQDNYYMFEHKVHMLTDLVEPEYLAPFQRQIRLGETYSGYRTTPSKPKPKADEVMSVAFSIDLDSDYRPYLILNDECVVEILSATIAPTTFKKCKIIERNTDEDF